MHRWDDPEGAVEFTYRRASGIRLFRANGFHVEDPIEGPSRLQE